RARRDHDSRHAARLHRSSRVGARGLSAAFDNRGGNARPARSVRFVATRRFRRAPSLLGDLCIAWPGVTPVARSSPVPASPGDDMSSYRPRHLTPPADPPPATGTSRRSLLRGGALGAVALGTGTAAFGATAANAAGIHGQDVSGWQGRVDWARQAELGSRFAYVKATEGRSYRSPAFDHQYIGAGNAGLVRGGYHLDRKST